MDASGVERLIAEALEQGLFKRCVYSRPLEKGAKKADARLVMMKGGLFAQITTYFVDGKARHENIPAESACGSLSQAFFGGFKQLNLYTADAERQIMLEKGGGYKVLTKIKQNTAPASYIDSHNRLTNYILEQKPTLFLEKLGVMDSKGMVFPRAMQKFRQINRFLEFIRDVYAEIGEPESVCVYDLCCGKGYLTTALYYYLSVIKGAKTYVHGVDLKGDMVELCTKVAKECGFPGLVFSHGDISDFKPERKADIVVALHACDTATDYALASSVKWDCRAILAAPCCQHELPAQIKADSLFGMLKYPIAKQRFAELLTDTLRAQILEASGYKVTVSEFIQIGDTPKNLLIKAVKREKPLDSRKKEALIADINAQMSMYSVEPALARLLWDRLT